MADTGTGIVDASDSHLWLRGASAFGFTHYVAAVSNLQWPVASYRPQVAVCGFFASLADATAFAAKHQLYKDSARTIPHGPIYLTLECGRLFPLSLSPRRLFGDQSAAAAKKRDAVIRNYYRRREAEALEVQRRKEEKSPEEKVEAAPVDERTQRANRRRARRHAWELLQRLRGQQDKLRRASQFLSADGGDKAVADMDDEMADFLEKLTPAQRESIAAGQRRAEQQQQEDRARAGAAAGAGAAAAVEEGAGGIPEEALKMDINPTPNTRVGTIEEYIAWAEQHFRKDGIVPASDEMMDAEEREEEARELAKQRKAGAEQRGAESTAFALPSPPSGQAFCVGAIYFDDAGARLNKDCEAAQGREHVVTFMSAHETSEAASKALEAAYAPALKQERLFFVRTGVWCCFDHVTEDDGVHMYREELMGDMLGKRNENQMLQFVEKALEQRPDMLPIPTVKA